MTCRDGDGAPGACRGRRCPAYTVEQVLSQNHRRVRAVVVWLISSQLGRLGNLGRRHLSNYQRLAAGVSSPPGSCLLGRTQLPAGPVSSGRSGRLTLVGLGAFGPWWAGRLSSAGRPGVPRALVGRAPLVMRPPTSAANGPRALEQMPYLSCIVIPYAGIPYDVPPVSWPQTRKTPSNSAESGGTWGDADTAGSRPDLLVIKLFADPALPSA